jgi:hypothetical protein
VEEPPDPAGHERHGQEDDDQRQRRRHDRERDLGRSPRRRDRGLLAVLLDAPEDVLQDDDRVVDDDAHRQHQPEHGQVVQREVEEAHEGEGGDDRGGDREPGHDRAAPVAHEEEHRERHQDGAQPQVLAHGVDRAVDEARLVADDLELHVGWQDGTELVELALHAVDHLHRVGAGLLAHDELHRVLAVQAGETPRLDDAVLGVAQVANVERPPADVRHDEVGEVAHVFQAPHRAHGQLAPGLVEPAAGQLDVLLRDGRAHLPDRQALGGQPVGVDEDVDGALLPAEQGDLPDARQRLDDLLHLPPAHLGHLAQAATARDRHRHHGHGVDVELVDHRGVGAGGELCQHRGDLVAHVLRGNLARLLEDEADDDRRHAFARRAAQLVEAGDGVDRLLEHLGDAGLHLLHAGAFQRGRDGDDREVDVREEVDPEGSVGEEAEHDGGGDEHRRQDRTADEDVREAHGPTPRA